MQDSDPTSTRKRRFRYTYVACEKCKARKSKCSGGQPCSRCSDANLTCFYSRTTRFRAPRRASASAAPQNAGSRVIDTHERQPGQVSGGPQAEATIAQTRAAEPTDSSPASASSRPDSFEHCLRLAESRFAATSTESGGPGFSPGRRTAKFHSHHMQQAVANRRSPASGGVLGVFDVESWIQLLHTYEEEIGMQYPCIDTRHLIGRICRAKAVSASPDVHAESVGSNASADDNLEDTALVLLAIISAFTDPAAQDIATPHIEEICGLIMMRTHLSNVKLDDLRLLVLTCVFFFLSDREKQAWRVIGVVMRLLQELTSDPDSQQRDAIPDSLFWTVYTLDRRWSFGTGLPFAVQDMDISRQPPPSNNGDLSAAYLSQMVVFCGIASEVRTAFLNNPSTCRSTLDAARDLVHFRIVQWQQNLPERLQFRGVQDRFNHTSEKRGDYKLRLMLYLRANQMRTIILRKSATRFGLSQLDETSAQNMAQIAHDSIRVLSLLVEDTDIYHAQHKTFNHFLETALSALLLVMCSGSDDSGHGPTAGISLGPAKTTSYLRSIVEATELVQRLATCSPITQRLKDKLQGIQKFIDAMAISKPRRRTSQQTTGHPAYWEMPASTNTGTHGAEHDQSLGQQDPGAAMLMTLSSSPNAANHAQSNLDASQDAAGANLPGSSSDPYPVLGENVYAPQATSVVSYIHGNDRRPPPSAAMGYAPFMPMPGGTSEATEAGLPSDAFTERDMEAAIADIAVDAFSDLNGILTDYDNLLF
ncbi:hypothetical protein NLU13_1167 [Sarocladium strictum]|uniref:Zn(2)-C6 fungal-type domain-containing protein n=1 Tax=Sarocladium strictum TaxID=5046 RepID=A0AA39LBZ2_SARSR|nr:hypothetical protein NLU13_1167 [Sarocladium strictum]